VTVGCPTIQAFWEVYVQQVGRNEIAVMPPMIGTYGLQAFAKHIFSLQEPNIHRKVVFLCAHSAYSGSN
jgi:hypothetical protein